MRHEHLCEHEQDGVDPLVFTDDPMLPPHVDVHECPECGMRAEYDTENGTYGVW